ncbi:O-antigen ligase family protein [Anaerotalea alkaliphila]|uniref:O-antigen ligase-related domain-containing protein n=1 Tax=Anaerotalea alkaliphila TaxID=2662126 RepID=A0A7X5KN80_9FIRM|nr:O-antigen ligase family protein [Anaerotalea alkaliphila]NDL66512.1 hypothetical protein [Anaerotalea alkaliphila]
MNALIRKIEASFLYRTVLLVVQKSQESMVFKVREQAPKDPLREYHRQMLLFHWAVLLGGWLDRVLDKLVRSVAESWIFGTVRKSFRWLGSLLAVSWTGRILGKWKPVYLVGTYVYVDHLVRTFLGGTILASTWDELLLVAFFGILLYRRFFLKQPWRFSDLDLPILLFLLTGVFLLFVNSPDFAIGVEGFRAVFQYVFWYFLVLQLVDSRETAKGMVWVLVAGAGLLGMHGIYQYATGAPMLGNWVDSTETITTRAYSIVRSPNSLGSLFVLYLPVGFGLFLGEKHVLKKLAALVLTAAMGFGLLFTFTRGAWITAFAGLLVVVLFLGKRLVLPILAVLGAALANLDTLYRRIAYLFTPEYQMKSSQGGRIYRWQTTLEEWSSSKLFGLGLGRYGGATALKNKLSPFYTDNYYMKTLAEMGIVGLTAFVLLMLVLLGRCHRYLRGVSDTSVRRILYGIYGGMVGVVLHNGVENIFENPFMVTYFWANAALLVAYSKHAQGVEQDE